MPYLENPNRIVGMKIRKRLGLPNKFGWIIPGWSEYGDDNDFSGVYQQRRSRTWDGVDGFIVHQDPRNFIMKPAWPSQPASAARDAQQEKFKEALSAWQSLTEEEKAEYRQIATRRSKRGYDYFMRKYLLGQIDLDLGDASVI